MDAQLFTDTLGGNRSGIFLSMQRLKQSKKVQFYGF